MPPTSHGLNCGCCQPIPLAADASGDPNPDDAATQNVTDLRRARQRARGVISRLMQAIITWMEQRDGELQRMLTSPQGPRRVNQAITTLASEHLRTELVEWLDERHRTTMGRAFRQAFDMMQATLPESVSQDDLRGEPRLMNRDLEDVRKLRQVDAGLLYDTELAEQIGAGRTLAEEVADDITRQLRVGIQLDEPIHSDRDDQMSLAERVRYVMQKSGAETQRQQAGVTGQTKRTKAELIAHDSVQDAYNTAARKRYLENGFRYAVYDATIDTRTTDLCRRMNEHAIDMVDSPWFVPPLHPYCRSGIRPILDLGDRNVLTRDDVADSYLQTIMSTKSYRPSVVGQDEYQPTRLSERYGQT